MRCMVRNRKFSVFGDSVSTLQGYQPERYAVEYEGSFAEESCVKTISDTWWGMAIRELGGELLVNDSYSGCTVTSWREDEMAFPSAASRERIEALCGAGVPDVLMIYLGTNDWGRCRKIGTGAEPWWRTFSGSYCHMLCDLRRRLPDTEIWCLNLTYSQAMAYHFYRGPLQKMEEYNRAIAEAAAKYGAKPVDLWTNASQYSSADLAHPDRAGMETIARAVTASAGRRPAGESVR